MPWREYFYFTKKEKTGLLVFSLIVALVFGWRFFPFQKQSLKEESSSCDTILPQKQEENFSGKKEKEVLTKKETLPSVKPIMHDFDPNTADSLVFARLGLPPFIARNIIRYRNKGGQFRKPEDFARIYGITEAQFKALRPYIKIAPPVKHPPLSLPVMNKEPLADTIRTVFKKQEKLPEGVFVDINSADTLELRKIPGIGASFARRIVKYRMLLGGYYSVEQIREVYGMSSEQYEKVLPWLTVENKTLQTLSVNKLSLERLKQHPYLSFYQAKAIVELRRKKTLGGLADLRLLEEFSEEELAKVEPYLLFE